MTSKFVVFVNMHLKLQSSIHRIESMCSDFKHLPHLIPIDQHSRYTNRAATNHVLMHVWQKPLFLIHGNSDSMTRCPVSYDVT